MSVPFRIMPVCPGVTSPVGVWPAPGCTSSVRCHHARSACGARGWGFAPCELNKPSCMCCLWLRELLLPGSTSLPARPSCCPLRHSVLSQTRAPLVRSRGPPIAISVFVLVCSPAPLNSQHSEWAFLGWESLGSSLWVGHWVGNLEMESQALDPVPLSAWMGLSWAAWPGGKSMTVGIKLRQTLSMNPSSAACCLPVNMILRTLGLSCFVCETRRYMNTYFAGLLWDLNDKRGIAVAYSGPSVNLINDSNNNHHHNLYTFAFSSQ